MIAFFRKIRQGLLKENKFIRYLLCTIGEIFLVVIGILLALQVNSWNQDQLDSLEEQKLIAHLYAEFDTNHRSIIAEIKYLESTKKNLEWVIELEKDKFVVDTLEIPLRAVFSTIASLTKTPTWNPSSFVLNDLKNSGRIQTLRDEDLVQLLFGWDQTYEDLTETSVFMLQNLEDLMDVFVKSGMIRLLNSAYDSKYNLPEESTVDLIQAHPDFMNIV
jgi:hypothetical protein